MLDNAIDGTAPDPPDLPEGDASYRSSHSQAGSTQGDRKTAAQQAVEKVRQGAPKGNAANTALSTGGSCPPLLGLTNELMGKIEKMLEADIPLFTSRQWGRITSGSHAEGRIECRQLYMLGLADRINRDNVYHYSFRFSKADFTAACGEVSKRHITEPVTLRVARDGSV